MHHKLAVIAALALALAGTFAQASEEPGVQAPSDPGVESSAYGFQFRGVLDVSYDWDDVLGPPGLHMFDVNQNGFSVHQVNVLVSKRVRDCLSATVNGILGDDAAVFSEDRIDFDLTQAYIDGESCVYPRFSFQIGRFESLAGYERINPADNLNASRGLLFFFKPLLHTGVRAKYQFTDQFSGSLGVNNGAVDGTQNSRVNTNNDQTLEAQVAYEHPAITVRLTAYRGDEDPNPTGGGNLTTQVLDVVAFSHITDSILVALNASRVTIEDIFGQTIGRDGVAAYLNARFGRYRVAPRFEYMDLDTNASESVWVREWTITLGYQAAPSLEFLAEVRQDQVDLQIGGLPPRNEDDTEPNDDQYTATFKAIFTF